MKPIFLIGFMGSGKSTLGRALAQATGMQFIDLDNYIERRFHANVRDIFASRGEQGFRDIERRMLAEVSLFENTVIACGGGTPCFFDNIDVMNATGTTVLLQASIAKLHERLVRGRHKRPLIADKTDDEILRYINSALDQRKQFYNKAKLRFEADLLDNREQIDASVRKFISEIIRP